MELAEASAICRVLSDPHRLVILEQLMEREQCGSELLKNFTFSQPTLSHHMKIMVEGGLVTERREGKRTYYGVESITQEFKSSAVFPPYNQRKSPQDIVDPELQKWAIIKAVCGFLNSRSGGDLLIGVNDEGYAAGLEDDMRELHARRYISTRDIDHYRLYIQRILTRAFAEVDGSKDPSEIANTHIDTFPETNAEGRTILRIKVSPYQRKIIRLSADKKDRPVGIEDSYVRQSGRTVVITPGMVEEIMKYKR